MAAIESVPFRHNNSFVAPQSKALVIPKVGTSKIQLNPAVVRNLDRIICQVCGMMCEDDHDDC
jgi:hypothetical protein